MILKNKSILIISPEPFSHIFVSKHHYATHLAQRGNTVFFLNPPTRKYEVLQTDYNNVFEINYPGFISGLRYFPGFLQKFFTRKVFNELQKQCSVNFDIVWSFDNSVFFRFDAIPNKVLKISHIVDLNQDFQTEKAASSADICLGVYSLLVKRLKEFNKNTHFVNHGFNKVEGLGNQEINIQEPVCIYAGNLAMPYLDWENVYETVKMNSNMNFLFIGPGFENRIGIPEQDGAKQNILGCSNVTIQGRVDNRTLQQFYKTADVLIISYQEKHHTDQSNPHKMMEYLGSSTMVVATYTAEYEELAGEGLIQMSNSNNEFPELFRKTIEDIDYWNSEEKKNARREYALDNTYDKQIDRIEKLISESLN